jgi:hypothetical protein
MVQNWQVLPFLAFLLFESRVAQRLGMGFYTSAGAAGWDGVGGCLSLEAKAVKAGEMQVSF